MSRYFMYNTRLGGYERAMMATLDFGRWDEKNSCKKPDAVWAIFL